MDLELSMLIIDLISEYIKCIDEKIKVFYRFYDMSKDFDAIFHHILLEKLNFYGFGKKAVRFFVHILVLKGCKLQWIDFLIY